MGGHDPTVTVGLATLDRYPYLARSWMIWQRRLASLMKC